MVASRQKAFTFLAVRGKKKERREQIQKLHFDGEEGKGGSHQFDLGIDPQKNADDETSSRARVAGILFFSREYLQKERGEKA